MNTCKCGKTKITLVQAPPGTSIQFGCPMCKGTAEAKV